RDRDDRGLSLAGRLVVRRHDRARAVDATRVAADGLVRARGPRRYSQESCFAIVTVFISTGWSGFSDPLAAAAIFFTISISLHLPKIVWWPSSHDAEPSRMKNWPPLVPCPCSSLPPLAIASTPGPILSSGTISSSKS